jgi:hypothetical protein
MGCNVSARDRVLFETADPTTGMKLIAATHKSRDGAEGWDLFITIKSASGAEIARSTVTSLDTPNDVGSGDTKIVGMRLDYRAQKAALSFQNGRTLSVPVVLWVDGDL